MCVHLWLCVGSQGKCIVGLVCCVALGATDFVVGMLAIVDLCCCGNVFFEMCGLSACVAAGQWDFKVIVCALARLCAC